MAKIPKWDKLFDDWLNSYNGMAYGKGGPIAKQVYDHTNGLIDIGDTLKELTKEIKDVHKRLNEIDDLIEAYKK
jgi:hypothetical protein